MKHRAGAKNIGKGGEKEDGGKDGRYSLSVCVL